MISALPNIVVPQDQAQADAYYGITLRNGDAPDFSEVLATRVSRGDESAPGAGLSAPSSTEPSSPDREIQTDSPEEPVVFKGELLIDDGKGNQTAIPVLILIDMSNLDKDGQPIVLVVPDTGVSDLSLDADIVECLNSSTSGVSALFSESDVGMQPGTIRLSPELLDMIASGQGAEKAAPPSVTIMTDSSLFPTAEQSHRVLFADSDSGKESTVIQPAAPQVPREQVPNVIIEFRSNESMNLSGWGIGRIVPANGPELSNNNFFTSSDTGTGENGQQPVFGITGLEGITPQNTGTAESFHIPALTESHADPEVLASSIVRHARFLVTRGESSATIRLEPPELGRLKLEIVTENANVTAKITVENREVRDLIQSCLPQLRENLTQSGLKVDSVDVLIGQNDQTGAWAGMDAFRERADRPVPRRDPEYLENMPQGGYEVGNVTGPAREVSRYSRFFDKWI